MQTKNMTIDPELCKRLDKAASKNWEMPDYAIQKSAIIRRELVDYISEFDAELASKVKNDCLYRLYTWAERVAFDWGKHDNERGAANAHNAHTQLANWK